MLRGLPRLLVAAMASAFACMVSTCGAVSVAGEERTKRAVTLDDVLGLEDLGRAVIAQDRYLVFEWIGSHAAAPNLHTLYSLLDRSALAKLYVSDLSTDSAPRPLFDQDARAGYWLGGLSPTGRFLVVYTMVDDSVRAGVYDFETRNVLWFPFTPNYFWLHQVPTWISDHELVFPTLPAGRQPAIVSRPRLASRLNELWRRAFEGIEPSATTLVSSPDGAASATTYRPGMLVRVDARTGRTLPLAEGYYLNFELSPDGRYLAALREAGAVQPDPAVPIGDAYDNRRRQLVVFDLRSDSGPIIPCPDCDVALGTLDWSATTDALVFFAQPLGRPADDGSFHRFSMPSSKLSIVDTGELRPGCTALWARPARATVLGKGVVIWARSGAAARARHFSGADCQRDKRHDWYYVPPDGKVRNLTGHFSTVSGQAVGRSARSLFVIADGDVWSLDPGRSPVRITRLASPGVSLWPHDSRAGGGSPEQHRYLGAPLSRKRIVLETPENFVSIDLRTSRIDIRNRSPRSARLAAISESGRTLAIRHGSYDGLHLRVMRDGEAPREILGLNTHLAEIAPPVAETFHFEHRGRRLSSCVLLPLRPVREPLAAVVRVYPDVHGGCPDFTPESLRPSDLRLLTTHGYAVLLPEIPRDAIRSAEGPTVGMSALLLAAVDEAARLGYIDRDRVGLYGFSQGHHSVLQVITQTDRFRAAVVLFGLSDFASHFGTMSLYMRLDPDRFGVGNAARYESPASDNYLGVAPWQDPQRYVDNSPVFRADRIITPVLIMHSDMDAFPLGQSEEMFSALFRLRKHATYVTYWGEGHGIRSPANIRDAWSRIIAWYNRFLRQQ